MNPDTFEQVLNTRMGQPFGLAYRVRSSPDGQYWLIEQKLGARGCFEVPFGQHDERYLRARDGYGLVLKTLKYPYFRCTDCGIEMGDVPEMEIAERKCYYCDINGQNSLYFLGYFPLCDALLEHLEFTHPKRGEQWQKDINARNREDMRVTKRKADNALDGVLRDDFRQMVDIPRAYLGDHRADAR